MKKENGGFIDTEEQASEGYDEHETVSKTTFIPLGIFLFVVAVWVVIKLSSLYPAEGDKLKVALDGLLGVFTLVVIAIQTGIIAMQWKAMASQDETMKGQLQHMEASLKRIEVTERPILIVTDVSAVFSGDQPIRISVTVTNKGATAARLVEIRFGFSPLPFVAPSNRAWVPPDEPMHFSGAEFLFAGEEKHFGANDRRNSDEVHDSVNKDLTGIYIFGEGSYLDMSGRQYTLNRWVFKYEQHWGFRSDTSMEIMEGWLRLIDEDPFSALSAIEARKAKRDKNPN